jgi:hypothetical protein
MLLARRDITRVDFVHDNVLLLQPTRIIKRKKIETDFRIISRLFADSEFIEAFHRSSNLKITLLVSGPVAGDNERYFLKLLRDFGRCVSGLPESVRDRVFLALLFSGMDYPAFRVRFERPFTIADLYGVASLVMLPSSRVRRKAAVCPSSNPPRAGWRS